MNGWREPLAYLLIGLALGGVVVASWNEMTGGGR